MNSSFEVIFRYLSNLRRKNSIFFRIKQVKALLYRITKEYFIRFPPKHTIVPNMYLWQNEFLFKYVELSSELLIKRAGNG